MTELVRNGPMYLSGTFPPVFPPPEWTGDDAAFDIHEHRFAWADSEGSLFHQASLALTPGKSYLVRFNAELNGSTVYATLGGGPVSPDVSVGGDCAVVVVAGPTTPGILQFHERAGSDAADSWITQVSCREVKLVPVPVDLLAS